MRPDLLAQGVAVETQQVRRLDLVAAAGIEGHGDQRRFHTVEDTLIEARRGQVGLMFAQQLCDVAFDRGRDIDRPAGGVHRRMIGDVEFALHDLERNVFVRVKRGQPPHQVFELADVARPGVVLH